METSQKNYSFSFKKDIHLVFVSFLHTYHKIYFLHILSLYFFLPQVILCFYFLLALLMFLYYLFNIFWLYLVLFLCFFDNKLFHSFFIYNKENHNDPLFSFKFEFFVILIALIFANIPKMNSIIASFNRNNSNITNHSKDMAHI